ncbi:MAG: hypothetical protein ABF296_10200 [Oceanococcaceae bacterium]
MKTCAAPCDPKPDTLPGIVNCATCGQFFVSLASLPANTPLQRAAWCLDTMLELFTMAARRDGQEPDDAMRRQWLDQLHDNPPPYCDAEFLACWQALTASEVTP